MTRLPATALAAALLPLALHAVPLSAPAELQAIDAAALARAFPGSGGANDADPRVALAREAVAKALGDDVRDLVFVPVAPCTVWDTRFATEPQSAGLIANGGTKRFFSHISGAGGSFAAWGGNPSCPEASENFIGGRPFAALMTVYISDATANGWLTLYRDGDSDPSLATISVYYAPGPTRTQTVIAKSSRGYGAGAFDIAATSRFGSTNASASVTGYFVKAVNINLPASTATTGNVNKAGVRFLHNYGASNTFAGVNTGNFTLTGQNNSGFGQGALFGLAGGGSNTALGRSAMLATTSGNDNAAVGHEALVANTTGSGNVAVGRNALRLNTTASFNTAVGFQALYSNADGLVNTAVGSNALASNTDGDTNSALGEGALYNNTTGSSNTAVGWNALIGNGTGNFSTAVGYHANAAATAGGDTAVGAFALEFASGGNNIGLGYGAGAGLGAGSGNIMIGHVGATGEVNTIRIGNGPTRAFIAGIRGATTGVANAVTVMIDSSGQLGTVNSSRAAKEDIADIDEASARLMKLRPVTFRYRAHKAAGEAPPQFGLIAEEVAQQMPELVARRADGSTETVYYHFLAPLLLNEYQRQQRTLERMRSDYEAKIGRLEAEMAELRRESRHAAELLRRLAGQERIPH